MKICFAASGGGHLRQILELKGLWPKAECFFVSENSVLLQSFEGPPKRLSVTPFALSEMKKKGRRAVLGRIGRNMVESFGHVRRERPDVVITTGAGSVFFTALFGRLSGAKLVVIETFSRSTGLSKFARIAGPIANQRVLQTPALSRFWPRAPIFDPIKLLPPGSFDKEDLILVTVGATLPFDRMVGAMAELKARGRVASRVVYQVGRKGVRPAGGEVHEEMPNLALQAVLARARIVVCHGGSGSIVPALQAGCHVIAFARREALGEHFDDHQQDLTEAFEARGLVLLARDAESLEAAITRTATRTVTRVTSDMADLSAYLGTLTSRWCGPPVHARRSVR